MKTCPLPCPKDPRDLWDRADCVIIATPTNYIPENKSFGTPSIEAVLEALTGESQGNRRHQIHCARRLP